MTVPPPAQDETGEQELRVVVDAQIVLSMFLARRDRPELASPKRQLLRLLPVPYRLARLVTDGSEVRLDPLHAP